MMTLLEAERKILWDIIDCRNLIIRTDPNRLDQASRILIDVWNTEEEDILRIYGAI